MSAAAKKAAARESLELPGYTSPGNRSWPRRQRATQALSQGRSTHSQIYLQRSRAHFFLPNVIGEPHDRLARSVLLGARSVTAGRVGSSALLGERTGWKSEELEGGTRSEKLKTGSHFFHGSCVRDQA